MTGLTTTSSQGVVQPAIARPRSQSWVEMTGTPLASSASKQRLSKFHRTRAGALTNAVCRSTSVSQLKNPSGRADASQGERRTVHADAVQSTSGSVQLATRTPHPRPTSSAATWRSLTVKTGSRSQVTNVIDIGMVGSVMSFVDSSELTDAVEAVLLSASRRSHRYPRRIGRTWRLTSLRRAEMATMSCSAVRWCHPWTSPPGRHRWGPSAAIPS